MSFKDLYMYISVLLRVTSCHLWLVTHYHSQTTWLYFSFPFVQLHHAKMIPLRWHSELKHFEISFFRFSYCVWEINRCLRLDCMESVRLELEEEVLLIRFKTRTIIFILNKRKKFLVTLKRIHRYLIQLQQSIFVTWIKNKPIQH